MFRKSPIAISLALSLFFTISASGFASPESRSSGDASCAQAVLHSASALVSPQIPEGLEQLMQPSEKRSVQERYPVFFVTSRRLDSKGTLLKFGNSRSDELTFGQIIPAIEASDSEGAQTLLFKSKQEFLDALKATGSKRAALFVHGYRKSFTATVDFGIKASAGLSMPLIVFAWPSKNNYCAYMVDECTAEWSSHQLSVLLGDLGDMLGYSNLGLVSHSLGARIVDWALRELYSERKLDEQIGAALFFNPDVDRGSFLHDSRFLKRACADCRVYLDNHDTRIRISRFLHGSPRLGSGKKSGSEHELSGIFRLNTSLQSHNISGQLVSQELSQWCERLGED